MQSWKPKPSKNNRSTRSLKQLLKLINAKTPVTEFTLILVSHSICTLNAFEMKQKCFQFDCAFSWITKSARVRQFALFIGWNVPFYFLQQPLPPSSPYNLKLVYHVNRLMYAHFMNFFFLCHLLFHLPTELTSLLLICFTLTRLMVRLCCGRFDW